MPSRTPAQRNQLIVFPELLAERIETGPHAARFFLYLAKMLDLSFYRRLVVLGSPRYNRPTLVAVVFYAMHKGYFEPQNIVQFTKDSIGAQWILNGMSIPSYKTVERIINDILGELDSVFTQILALCDEVDLIGGEIGYIDGVKVQANASKHKAMSYEYLGKKIERGTEDLKTLFGVLRGIVDSLEDITEEELHDIAFEDAAKVHKGLRKIHQKALDTRQDKIFNRDYEETEGQMQTEKAEEERAVEEIKSELHILENIDLEKHCDAIEMLNNIAFVHKRVSRMEEAKAELEDRWKKENGNKKIPDKKQINFTDSDSCIMQTKHHGVQQCYNNFAVVDNKANIILGCYTNNNPVDQLGLIPCVKRTEQTYGSMKGMKFAGDAGFFCASNISYCKGKEIDFYASYPEAKSSYAKDKFKYNESSDTYICPRGNVLSVTKESRDEKTHIYSNKEACSLCENLNDCTKAKDGIRKISRDMEDDKLREEGREKANSAEGREILRLRKSVPEPVWGNIKTQDGFIQMHYRGIDKAGLEFELHCIMQNIRKLLKVYFKSKSYQDIVHKKTGGYCKVA